MQEKIIVNIIDALSYCSSSGCDTRRRAISTSTTIQIVFNTDCKTSSTWASDIATACSFMTINSVALDSLKKRSPVNSCQLVQVISLPFGAFKYICNGVSVLMLLMIFNTPSLER